MFDLLTHGVCARTVAILQSGLCLCMYLIAVYLHMTAAWMVSVHVLESQHSRHILFLSFSVLFWGLWLILDLRSLRAADFCVSFLSFCDFWTVGTAPPSIRCSTGGGVGGAAGAGAHDCAFVSGCGGVWPPRFLASSYSCFLKFLLCVHALFVSAPTCMAPHFLLPYILLKLQTAITRHH